MYNVQFVVCCVTTTFRRYAWHETNGKCRGRAWREGDEGGQRRTQDDVVFAARRINSYFPQTLARTQLKANMPTEAGKMWKNFAEACKLIRQSEYISNAMLILCDN